MPILKFIQLDIIASDALKNTKWGHTVKTYCLSHTHEIKFTPPQPNL